MSSEVWQLASPGLLPSERRPGAPIIQVTLSTAGPVEFSEQGGFCVNAQFTYEGVPTDIPLRPITVHTYRLQFAGYSLCRQNPVDNKIWENCPPEGCDFAIYDDPDVIVRVGHHEDFITLHPGQSWIDKYWIDTDRSFPGDLKVGDLFGFQYKGTILDWWDWGTREDHVDTIVKLPCCITTDVLDPKDNEGRPELLIPASNSILFPYLG